MPQEVTPVERAAPPKTVFVEEARFILRPDRALDLARLLHKTLNHILDNNPEQAAMFGISQYALQTLAGSRFDGAPPGGR